MANKHFIIIGRTSVAIAQSITQHFGSMEQGGDGLVIDRPSNVFQSRFGTFGDGESIFELFVDGKLSDHPIEQHLTEQQKQEIEKNLEGSHITIVHSISGDNTSSRAFSLLDGVYDLKNKYRASSVAVIAPHLPFMRNDRRFRKLLPDGTELNQRNAVAGRNYARRLRAEGTDFVTNFEPHSRDGVKNYNEFFPGCVQFINTGDFFAEDFLKEHEIIDSNGNLIVCIGSPDGLNKPDDYGIHRAKSFALSLLKNSEFGNFNQDTPIENIRSMFGIHKERKNEKETVVVRFFGDVQGKHAVIVDDIFSSGGTTIEAAKALKEKGARFVTAIATHAVLVNGGLQKLLDSPFIDEVRMTDTIPSAHEKAEDYLNHPKLRIKTVSPLIIREIQNNHDLRFDCRWHYPFPRNNLTASYAPTLHMN